MAVDFTEAVRETSNMTFPLSRLFGKAVSTLVFSLHPYVVMPMSSLDIFGKLKPKNKDDNGSPKGRRRAINHSDDLT